MLTSHYADHTTIGSVPSEEECAQIDQTPGFDELNKLECTAFIWALRAVYGDEPKGARLEIHDAKHEFGIYREVIYSFDEKDPEGARYAEMLEDSDLCRWSDAGFWAPVVYDSRSAYPVHVIRPASQWLRKNNPGARARSKETLDPTQILARVAELTRLPADEGQTAIKALLEEHVHFLL